MTHEAHLDAAAASNHLGAVVSSIHLGVCSSLPSRDQDAPWKDGWGKDTHRHWW